MGNNSQNGHITQNDEFLDKYKKHHQVSQAFEIAPEPQNCGR
jgi:hypothetical protein